VEQQRRPKRNKEIREEGGRKLLKWKMIYTFRMRMHALDKEGADPQQQQSRLRRRRRLWQARTYLATVLIEVTVIKDALTATEYTGPCK
jgi:hypothetical protein